ncbi:hypothetical protein R6Q57_025328 [Mikania cordata]
MKVSFSLSSSKPTNSTLCSSSDHSEQKELITEFHPSKTLTNSIVIPPIPNEWKPQMQSMNIDSPTQSDSPTIQSESDPNFASEFNISNTTNGRKGYGSDSASSIDRLMLMRLRNDLKRLPDDRGLGEFDDVPVEDFARAYLKGYGWCEGRGIGKNAKEDVKVVEYTNNAAGEGLGFVRTVEGDRKTVKSKTFVNNGKKY